MGLRSTSAGNTVNPAVEILKAQTGAEKSEYEREQEKRVRGQVRMNAIQSGYASAAILAPVVGNGPEHVELEYRRIARATADDIVAYTFEEDK